AFREAIQADPGYAPAHAGLADAYLFCYCSSPLTEVIPKAKAAALRALSLDRNLAEAHATLGFIDMTFEYDWPAAERELQRAIALNPNYAVGHQFYGGYLTQSGRWEEGIQEVRRALELDPLSLALNWSLGLTLYHARQYEHAAEQLRRT